MTAGATSCLAGAWTQPENGIYDKLGVNIYYASKNFDRNGNRAEMPGNGTFRDFNLTNYIEYGLTRELTLINSIPFKVINNSSTTEANTTTGVGDIDLAARYKLTEGGWGLLSTQALIKIPWAYDSNARLPLGNGQGDYEGKLLYGCSLWRYLPGYVNLELGYRYRAGGPADEFKYLVEFGSDITKSLYTRLKLDGTMSMDNGARFDYSGNPTTTNNYDLGKLEVTVGYKITPSWGVELTYGPALYGQNTAAGATYSFALFYQTPSP